MRNTRTTVSTILVSAAFFNSVRLSGAEPLGVHDTIDGLHMLGAGANTDSVDVNIQPLDGAHDVIVGGRVPGGFANPFFALTASVDPSGRFSNRLLNDGFFGSFVDSLPSIPSDTIPKPSIDIGSLGTPIDIPFGNPDHGFENVGNPTIPVFHTHNPLQPSPGMRGVVVGQPIMPVPGNVFNSEKTIGLHFDESPSNSIFRQPVGAPHPHQNGAIPSLRFGGPFVRTLDMTHVIGPIHDYSCLFAGPGHKHPHSHSALETTLMYPFPRLPSYPVWKRTDGKVYRPFIHPALKMPYMRNHWLSKVPVYEARRIPFPTGPRLPFPMRPGTPFPMRSGSPFPMRSGSPFPMRPKTPFPMRPGTQFPMRPGTQFPLRPGTPFVRPGTPFVRPRTPFVRPGTHFVRPGVPFPLRPKVASGRFPFPSLTQFPLAPRMPLPLRPKVASRFPFPSLTPFPLAPRMPLPKSPGFHVHTDKHFHVVNIPGIPHPFGKRLVPHTTKVVHFHHG